MKIFYLNIILLSFFSCNILSPGINYRSHSDFKNFWSDFRTAVLSKEIDKVFSMTKIPFYDGYEVYEPETTLRSETKEIFLTNYDKIFSPEVINAIRMNKLLPYNPSMEDDPGGSVMKEGDYMLIVESGHDGRIRDLHFEKVKEIYKLTGIPYYP